MNRLLLDVLAPQQRACRVALCVALGVLPLLVLFHLLIMSVWMLAALAGAVYASVFISLVFLCWRAALDGRLAGQWGHVRASGVARMLAGYCAATTALVVVMTWWAVQVWVFDDDAPLAALGSVTATSVAVWVRNPAASTVHVTYRPTGAGSMAASPASALSESVQVRADRAHTGVAWLEDLLPRTEYTYSAAADAGAAFASGTFRTLPTAAQALNGSLVTFGSTSCIMARRALGMRLGGLRALLAKVCL
jgi:hypothetical protein